MRTIINCSNNNIALKNVPIDFEFYGIYLIKGDNGSGKSTLLKNLLFEDNEIYFNNESTKQVFDNARYKVCAFVEQNPIADFSSVKEYLCKTNENVRDEELYYYLKMFRIDYLSMEERVEFLSGGEIAKLNIVACLLKNTPYIIMDEPTNNLDDESVEVFIDLLKDLKTNHTIIIVSHDPRLDSIEATTLLLEHGALSIINNDDNNKDTNTEEIGNVSMNLLTIWASFLQNKTVLAISLIKVVIIAAFFVISIIGIHQFYNLESLPQAKNVIVSYIVDETYSNLNKTYVDSQKLDISDRLSNKLICYDDLDYIEKIKGVTDVIISDDEYANHIFDIRDNQDLLSNFVILAIPNNILTSYCDIIQPGLDPRYIDAGRYPADGKKEVCISKGLLEKHYKNVDFNSPIGAKICIGNNEYTIVGICHEDICLISYSINSNFGFVSYKNSKFFDTVNRNIDYQERVEAYNLNKPEYVIVFTEDGKERNVLNDLIQHFPANNYYSYYFAESFADFHNAKGRVVLLVVNFIASIICALLILLLTRKNLLLFKVYNHNLDVYYLKNNSAMKSFLLVQLLEVLVGIFALITITYFVVDYIVLVQLLYIVWIPCLLIGVFPVFKRYK